MVALEPILKGLPRNVLIERIKAQSERIQELNAENEQQAQEIKHLKQELEEAQRNAFRQAAPFRRKASQRKKPEEKRKPGRAKGHPPSWKNKPPQVDRHEKVALKKCPHCAGDLQSTEQSPIQQTIIELPSIKAEVIELTTYRCLCPHCQSEVSSSHPLKVSEATGAAGVHLGPQALGWASALNKQYGLSMRKTCAVMEELCGLSLSPGGLSQALDRIACKLEAEYQESQKQLREGPLVHVDETSWWVGERGWWLWVFTTPEQTLYKVRPSRRRDVITETLGQHYGGVLISDCLNIYDNLNQEQQKCYAHHLKAISKALEEKPKSDYLQNCRTLLKGALALKEVRGEVKEKEYSKHVEALEESARELLHSPRAGPEEKIRNRLHKQVDHLFTFLRKEGVEATNNLAERQLRPAVISRKISCGNKTAKGARSWEVLSSIAATCVQAGKSFADKLASQIPLHVGIQAR